MLKCPYCGQEYPDNATVCPCDGQPLTPSPAINSPPVDALAVDAPTVEGVWRGVYNYAESAAPARINQPVRFTFKLQQDFPGHFTGTVTEDVPLGMPGMGVVDGYFSPQRIELNKHMPVAYVTAPDGSRMTLREYIISKGHECGNDMAAPPIAYEGTFLDAKRIQGTWFIEPFQIPLSGGPALSFRQRFGFWCAELVTTDLNASPTDGPTEPFFDKTQPAGPETAESVVFHRLGKFDVMEAEGLLKKFEIAKLRFEINREDSAIRQMPPIMQINGGYSGTAPMIEIFIHPEDEAQAVTLMNEDHLV